eukprot:m51a1_g7273 putative domain containing protein (1060) ;mRNA; f:224433-229299
MADEADTAPAPPTAPDASPSDAPSPCCCPAPADALAAPAAPAAPEPTAAEPQAPPTPPTVLPPPSTPPAESPPVPSALDAASGPPSLAEAERSEEDKSARQHRHKHKHRHKRRGGDEEGTPGSSASTASAASCGGGVERSASAGAKALSPEDTARKWLAEQTRDTRFTDPATPLTSLLADGTVLCKLLNKFFPDTVVVPHASAIPFKQMEAVQRYLDGCRKVGAQEHHMFASSAMYEGRDLHCVVGNVLWLQRASTSSQGGLSEGTPPAPAKVTSVRRSKSMAAIKFSPPPSYESLEQAADEAAKVRYSESAQGLPGRARLADVTRQDDDARVKSELMYNTDVEQSVREWIAAVLEEPHLFDNAPSITSALKSGVILCRLVNKIKPGLVSKIHKMNVPFMQLENLNHYMEACKALGIRDSDLFMPSDLFEGKNMTVVVNHLYVFATSLHRMGKVSVAIRSTKASRSLFSQILVKEQLDDVSSAASSPSDVAELEQHRELLAWANKKMEGLGVAMENFGADVRNGVKLLRLVECVTKTQLPAYDESPKIMWSAMQNACLLFRIVMQSTFSSLDCCTPQDIVLGNGRRVASLVAYLRERFDLDYAFMRLLNDGEDKMITLEEASECDESSAGSPEQRGLRSKSPNPRRFPSTLRLLGSQQQPAGASPQPLKSPAKPPSSSPSTLSPQSTPASGEPKMSKAEAERVLRARTAMRKRVADEILQTEESYSTSLDSLVRDLITPLQAAWLRASRSRRESVAPDEMEAIFANLEAIAVFHREFLTDLRMRMSVWGGEATLGDVFLLKADAMACYGPYLRNYAGSIVSVHYLAAKSPAFLAAVRDFEARQANKLTLQSFLVMPVQRLPRYLLLLKELRKFTPKQHADRALLQAAEKALLAVTERINSGVDPRSGDAARRAIAIAESIEGLEACGVALVSADRRPVREGRLVRLEKKGSRLGHSPYCFLFTDVLVLCEQSKAPRSPAQPFALIEVAAIARVARVAVSAKREHALLLMDAAKRKPRWTLEFASDEERALWEKDLGATVAANATRATSPAQRLVLDDAK